MPIPPDHGQLARTPLPRPRPPWRALLTGCLLGVFLCAGASIIAVGEAASRFNAGAADLATPTSKATSPEIATELAQYNGDVATATADAQATAQAQQTVPAATYGPLPTFTPVPRGQPQPAAPYLTFQCEGFSGCDLPQGTHIPAVAGTGRYCELEVPVLLGAFGSETVQCAVYPAGHQTYTFAPGSVAGTTPSGAPCTLIILSQSDSVGGSDG